jgi:hypothetical protein
MDTFRPSFRRRLESARNFFATLLTTLRPETQEFPSQRMCPFCGRITPRAERHCLECGKLLRSIQEERRAAHQE